MHIAQITRLTESIPPRLYGGTERVVSWLTNELVSLGHDVVFFASGDSHTSANLESCWPKALRLDGSIRDPNALHMTMLERVRRRAQDFGPARIPVEGERTEGRPNAKVTIDLRRRPVRERDALARDTDVELEVRAHVVARSRQTPTGCGSTA